MGGSRAVLCRPDGSSSVLSSTGRTNLSRTGTGRRAGAWTELRRFAGYSFERAMGRAHFRFTIRRALSILTPTHFVELPSGGRHEDRWTHSPVDRVHGGRRHRAVRQCDLDRAVKDTSGAVLPGATITARNVATNEIRTTVSNTEGIYRLTGLPRGTYEVTAELQGFKTVAQSDVLLTVGDTVRLDFDARSRRRWRRR